jgi:lactoylglutathione lyase
VLKRIDHIGLLVTDMERSIAWYQSVLGLGLRLRVRMNEQTELAFLTLGETEIELVAKSGGGDAPLDGVVNHLAFRVDEIDGVLERLRQQGVTLLSERPADLEAIGVRVAFFRGPDGEKLELVEALPAR